MERHVRGVLITAHVMFCCLRREDLEMEIPESKTGTFRALDFLGICF